MFEAKTDMPDKYERFVTAFLRLNGYFTVPNFIVHAADDPGRISGGLISSHTETDTIAIRMPHSAEVTGAKTIVNFEPLVCGAQGRFDIIFAEVKSGKNAKPNGVWVRGNPDPAITYLVRFVGYHEELQRAKVARQLVDHYRYEDGTSRYRYVIFASEINKHYAAKGVTYITFREAAEFLVDVRGESWAEANIGVASIHQQWDEMLKDLFEIANKHQTPRVDRVAEIEQYLAG